MATATIPQRNERRFNRRRRRMSVQSCERVTIEDAARYAQATGAGSSPVDWDGGVIRGVKVVGLQSVNPARVLDLPEREFGAALDRPYRYDAHALNRAQHLYENAAVFIGHPEFSYDRTGARRPAPGSIEGRTDLFGWLKNVRMTPEGIRADLHFLKSHRDAPRIAELAQRNPSRVALSHLAATVPELVGDQVVITDIAAVESVDLIFSRPGTTRTLFESGVDPMALSLRDRLRGDQLAQLREDIADRVAEKLTEQQTAPAAETAAETPSSEPTAEETTDPEEPQETPAGEPTTAEFGMQDTATMMGDPAMAGMNQGQPQQPQMPTLEADDPMTGDAEVVDDPKTAVDEAFRAALVKAIENAGDDDTALLGELTRILKAKQAASAEMTPAPEEIPPDAEFALGADEELMLEEEPGEEPVEEEEEEPMAKESGPASGELILEIVQQFNEAGVPVIESQVEAAAALPADKRQAFIASLKPDAAGHRHLEPRSAPRKSTAAESGANGTPNNRLDLTDPVEASRLLRLN